jgi:hypothetical protein
MGGKEAVVDHLLNLGADVDRHNLVEFSHIACFC